MNPHSFEKLLQQDAPPPPDAAARRAARQAALAEFARVHAQVANDPASSRWSLFQALLGGLRLSSQTQRSDDMPWYSRRMLLGGAASVCLVVVGGALAWKTLRVDPSLAELSPEYQTVSVPTKEVGEVPPPPPQETVPADAPRESAPAEQAPAEEESRREAERAAAQVAGSRQQLARKEQDAQSARERVLPAPAAAAPAKDAETDEVVVTGLRSQLKASMEVKREAVGVVDAITAEDIGTLQDQNTAEALQRVPGVSVSRSDSMAGVFSNAPAARMAPGPQEYQGRDKFEHFDLNPLKRVVESPVSTFSVDVDTSSYSFVRRQLQSGVLPQKDAVRVEEMVNYFDYAWPAAETRAQPFKPTVVVSDSPWNKGRKLVTIGIKGYEIPRGEQPDANLVLLMDVSGSMSGADRLPLAIQSMELLLGSLKPTDTVAIVVYAGAAGKVLDPTPVRDKDTILEALHRLQAGGSTAGAEGIKLAYELAESSFRKGGMNRVLLATDGDFNVGIDSTDELKGFVERQREKGIFLSVLGYGMGNYRDEMAQALAQNGNGVAAYIDSLAEARKVLVEQATGSLFTIAKDVKLQVEFNPDTVAEYRLVGYETRALKREDFNNDAVDAGDVGAGHTVTAIYEITPLGAGAPSVDPRRYASEGNSDRAKPGGLAGEWGFLKIRYKLPDGQQSKLLEQPIRREMPAASAAVKRDVQFSTAVAGFAQLLRGGQYTGKLRYDDVIEDAEGARGNDRNGYRAEFVQLVRKARTAKGM
ncbi:MAG TPA: von Willebrand factor type A domain-containing protein [Steroidobacteraceae bacterium]